MIPEERRKQIIEYNKRRKADAVRSQAGQVIADFMKKVIPVRILKPLLTEKVKEALRAFGIEI